MSDITNDVFFEDDDWSDIDFSDLVDEPSSDGDEEPQDEDTVAKAEEENNPETTEANPAEEAEESGAKTSSEPVQQANTDQYFDLKVLGQDRRLSRDEMIAAAQKGLDYDRVKGKNDELKREREANAPAIELMKELAESQNITVDQLITNVRAAALARKENISIEAATEKVKLNAREAAVSKREAVFKQQDDAAAKEAADKQARNVQFIQFFKNHPGVKPADIPQQCFIDMKNGIPLEQSYTVQTAAKKQEESSKALSEKDKEIQELKAKLAAFDKKSNSQNQNQINAARSVGSADSAGKGSKDDAFDAAWYDGT